MTCVICRTGETHAGHATVTLHRAYTTVVIKQVPADICDAGRQQSHVTFRTLTQPSPERERARM
jgi:YgiT-type zinc finger domain-containing protein